MDAEAAAALLGGAGFPVDPRVACVEPRDDRWAVSLPGDRMAWFPMNPSGARRLAVERRVLDLLATRCSFRAPRVVHVDEAAGWQLRELVPGTFDPWGLYRRVKADRALARRVGRALGSILAEQHACARPGHVAGWLPDRLPWPAPAEELWATLPQVVIDPGLLHVIERVLRRYEDATGGAAPGDRVLVHGDLGLHNIVLVPGTDGEVAGVFDYDGAAWADRRQDFRYLLFDQKGEEMLEGALEVYEPATGLRIDRDLVRLGNAACAIGFLAFRRGTPPDERSCGRTLAEDLDWLGWALRGLGEA